MMFLPDGDGESDDGDGMDGGAQTQLQNADDQGPKVEKDDLLLHRERLEGRCEVRPKLPNVFVTFKLKFG
jgi:hypothetical protein